MLSSRHKFCYAVGKEKRHMEKLLRVDINIPGEGLAGLPVFLVRRLLKKLANTVSPCCPPALLASTG